MSNIKNLTTGNISSVITSLAAPLIGASFVQMAYTMTDLLWLGRLGSAPVAAVGAAFFFTWFNTALTYTPKMGTEITVSQSLGAGDRDKAFEYASNGLSLSMIMGLLFGIIVLFAAPLMLGIFKLEPHIEQMGVSYLRLVIPGMVAAFVINACSSVYYATGDSKLPFRIVGIGLIANIILDPLLIFGWAGFPKWGTEGAAIASSISQLIVMTLFLARLYSRRSPLKVFPVFPKLKLPLLKRIIRLGLPVSMQSVLFSMIGMSMNSFAARYGHVAVAVYSLGSQIEAISWMTAGGFSTALSSFVGQNYGAKEYQRIKDAYRIAICMAGVFGLVATVAFVSIPDIIFSWFINEPESILEGSKYLRIMGYSQLFMVIELVTAGGFNGVGKTAVPAYVGIIFNFMRVPVALFLMSTVLEVTGIWWSITISSIFKGSVLVIWFYFGVLRRLNYNTTNIIKK